MATALLCIRCVLAVVLVVAAVGKLLDRPGSAEALSSFGVPKRLVGATAIALPATELAAAAMLLIGRTALAGAGASLALIGLFTVGVARVVAGGHETDCHCFGALGSRPVSRATLARNAVLAALAGFVVLAGAVRGTAGPSAIAWIGDLHGTARRSRWRPWRRAWRWSRSSKRGSRFELFRQNGRLWSRLDQIEHGGVPGVAVGLEAGTAVPQSTVRTLDGNQVELADVLDGSRALLLLTDPTCGACDLVLGALEPWRGDSPPARRLVIISGGELETVRAYAARHELGGVLLQSNHAVAKAFGVLGVPAVVLVEDGRVMHTTAGAHDVRAAIATAAPADLDLAVVQVLGIDD